MLEVAASPAYKDLMDALGKLAEWTEQAGKGELPSGPPSEDLVRQFNEALQSAPTEGAARADAVNPADGAVRSAEAVPDTTPADVIGKADMFQQDNRAAVHAAHKDAGVDHLPFDDQRRGVERMTNAQEINMDRGLDALDNAADTRRTEFFQAAQDLSQLLSNASFQLSPVELLQAQRLIGVLQVEAESGKKTSEGVSDTLEQLLEQQG